MGRKTEILKIKGDWVEVASDCRSTVGKPPLDHEPSVDFKRKILIAEHSPIRDISVKWAWHGIKSWVATHWSRHKFEKYIKSQRSDRTGIPRDKLPQHAPVDFTGEANVQSLIDTMRKRLCRQSSPEARRYDELMVMLRAEIITDLRLQPQFTLQESYLTEDGQRIRAIRYTADFSYRFGGKLVVEDVKSKPTRTKEYLRNKKMMRSKYGIDIQEV